MLCWQALRRRVTITSAFYCCTQFMLLFGGFMFDLLVLRSFWRLFAIRAKQQLSCHASKKCSSFSVNASDTIEAVLY
jgi:hypothetical protein